MSKKIALFWFQTIRIVKHVSVVFLAAAAVLYLLMFSDAFLSEENHLFYYGFGTEKLVYLLFALASFLSIVCERRKLKIETALFVFFLTPFCLFALQTGWASIEYGGGPTSLCCFALFICGVFLNPISMRAILLWLGICGYWYLYNLQYVLCGG